MCIYVCIYNVNVNIIITKYHQKSFLKITLLIIFARDSFFVCVCVFMYNVIYNVF